MSVILLFSYLSNLSAQVSILRQYLKAIENDNEIIKIGYDSLSLFYEKVIDFYSMIINILIKRS